jgi:ketosteroid isomerase-like protein
MNPEPVNPIETVQHIYAAFGRQDIGSILDAMSDDVVWEYAYDTAAHAEAHAAIAWLLPRRGKDGVLGFFQALGAGLAIRHFEVTAVLGEGTRVVALVDLDAEVTQTGQSIRERDEVHIWHFDAAGKVIRFRHASDTLQHYRAATRQR